jgi:hypothetical protein
LVENSLNGGNVGQGDGRCRVKEDGKTEDGFDYVGAAGKPEEHKNGSSGVRTGERARDWRISRLAARTDL